MACLGYYIYHSKLWQKQGSNQQSEGEMIMIGNKHSQTQKAKIYPTLAIIFIGALLSLILFTMSAEMSAMRRGHEGDTPINPFQLHTQNQRNHIVHRAYAPAPGDIVIYVRYGCSLCEMLYSEINELLRAHDSIYIVGTRTDIGRALREDYPISIVPSAVLIGSNLSYVPLAIEGASGGIVLDRYGFNLLLAERKSSAEVGVQP